MSSIKVLYEDNHMIAVYKPAGILTQGDRTGDESLMDMVKDYLKEKYGKPGNVFLAPVHRIDRPVSGIVLYAKTTKGASRISAQFREREIKKTYHAIVIGKMEKPSGEIVNYIKKVSYFAQAFVDGKNIGEGGDIERAKKAELCYRVIKSNNECSLLEINPKTGRFHQIRIQLASIGHPIIGDKKYGPQNDKVFRKLSAPFFKDRSIALCATSISFSLPTKEEIKTVSIPYPEDWKKYF